MVFKEYIINEDESIIYARIDDDGICRLTCTIQYPELQEWVETGNIVLGINDPWPEPIVINE